jgi:acetyltransferase-like isoleucine patch superfamily enzyme
MGANEFIRKVKRGETPAYRFLRFVARAVVRPRAPRVPGFLKPLLRLLYETHFGVIQLARWVVAVSYRHPLFQARCASVGRNLSLETLPYVDGHVEIHIGDNVTIGRMSVASGRFLDRPRLIIKDRAEIGWGVSFGVSKEVIVEEDVRVSFNCRISDTDGHRREADLRAQNAPVDPRDIRPVRICRYAWIGNGCHIMKGVTIGEGAVIGANSVVISDIPPYSLAMGNPAEVYFRNYGRPSGKAASSSGSRP